MFTPYVFKKNYMEKIIIPSVNQVLPSLFTIDGLEYEFKIVSKRSILNPLDVRPLANVLIGVINGSTDSLIVPNSESIFNIFIQPTKKIIPISYFSLLSGSTGNTPVDFTGSTGNYNKFVFLQRGLQIADFTKSTQVTAKIQPISFYQTSPIMNNNVSLPLTKNDFIEFSFGEKIIFPVENEMNRTMLEFIFPYDYFAQVNILSISAGLFYFSQTFTYLELK